MVLVQRNSFIVHRIQNPDEQEYFNGRRPHTLGNTLPNCRRMASRSFQEQSLQIATTVNHAQD